MRLWSKTLLSGKMLVSQNLPYELAWSCFTVSGFLHLFLLNDEGKKRLMLMEMRRFKVTFPKTVTKSDRLEILSYRRDRKNGEKMFVLKILFVHAAARGGTCASTLKIVSTLIENSSRDDRPSISILNQPNANALRVGQSHECRWRTRRYQVDPWSRGRERGRPRRPTLFSQTW